MEGVGPGPSYSFWAYTDPYIHRSISCSSAVHVVLTCADHHLRPTSLYCLAATGTARGPALSGSQSKMSLSRTLKSGNLGILGHLLLFMWDFNHSGNLVAEFHNPHQSASILINPCVLSAAPSYPTPSNFPRGVTSQSFTMSHRWPLRSTFPASCGSLGLTSIQGSDAEGVRGATQHGLSTGTLVDLSGILHHDEPMRLCIEISHLCFSKSATYCVLALLSYCVGRFLFNFDLSSWVIVEIELR